MADAPVRATVVVQHDDKPATDVRATTPAGVPNYILKTMQPVEVILVRAARVFLQTLVALLTAGSTGLANNTLPAHDFSALLYKCAGLSVAAAVVCAIQNTIELMARLDETLPQLRG